MRSPAVQAASREGNSRTVVAQALKGTHTQYVHTARTYSYTSMNVCTVKLA